LNRTEVLRKLDGILAQAELEKTFGCIEMDLRAGRVVILRKTETERFEDQTMRETTHAKNFR